ncbi:TrmH family RNA methyltransferase [Candidatus Saccharibacteria bacterium]|nr:TrmH family RNA methyltransferase [Candidatus Saccharibacteria bacterium]
MKSREFASSGREIVVIAHNIRSIQNVGSILRTSEGFGVARVFATGYTPIPTNGLPHVRAKLARDLHKTALGAEEIVDFVAAPDVFDLIEKLRADGFRVVGLEQDARAISLPEFNSVIARSKATKQSSGRLKAGSPRCARDDVKIALLLGEEVNGLTPELRDTCDDLIEIPMFGRKESFNVSVACGIALYELSI